MRRRFSWWLSASAGVALCCAVVAGWGVHDALVARECLGNGLGRPDWTGTTIVEEGCLLTTETGNVLVKLHGPTIGSTLVALVGGALSTALFGIMIIIRVTAGTRAR